MRYRSSCFGTHVWNRRVARGNSRTARVTAFAVCQQNLQERQVLRSVCESARPPRSNSIDPVKYPAEGASCESIGQSLCPIQFDQAANAAGVLILVNPLRPRNLQMFDWLASNQQFDQATPVLVGR
jgi:hypothetical protein